MVPRLLGTIAIVVIFLGTCSCGNPSVNGKGKAVPATSVASQEETNDHEDAQAVTAILVSPKNPRPGELFHVLLAGGKNIQKAKLLVSASSGVLEPTGSRSGEGLPFWRIEEFKATSKGKYMVALRTGGTTTSYLDFTVTEKPAPASANAVWNTEKGWDARTEALYSAWVNALFYDADERSSWTALQEVTYNRDRNFLYNYLSLNEDDPTDKNRVLMQPDCADNPFYLRAYFRGNSDFRSVSTNVTGDTWARPRVPAGGSPTKHSFPERRPENSILSCEWWPTASTRALRAPL